MYCTFPSLLQARCQLTGIASVIYLWMFFPRTEKENWTGTVWPKSGR